MAEIITGITNADVRKTVVASPGEILRVQVLNADGSVKSTEIEAEVPGGKVFDGMVMLLGVLRDPV